MSSAIELYGGMQPRGGAALQLRAHVARVRAVRGQENHFQGAQRARVGGGRSAPLQPQAHRPVRPSQCGSYGDEKVANRDISRVWHGATEKGP
jgi:hypothetical protein